MTKGIAFIIIIAVGGLFYNAVAKKIELTWSKVIVAYAVAAAILFFGLAVDSDAIFMVGMILCLVFGLLVYGKMFN